MTAVKRSYAYILALLAEVALFHRHVLFERGYLFPWDFRGVHLPFASFIAASLHRGEFPLWEPYTYCGNPIFANIQAALFYPPVLLATAASNWFGPDSLPRLLAIAVCLQIFFAGVCTFALLRRLGTTHGAAFVAATAYQLGCFFAAQPEHMGAMHGGTWIPLTWLAVWELREAWRRRWMAILALSLAMAALAGLPQVAVAAFGSAVALSFVVGRRFGAQLRVITACVWALLLAAVQLIPTAELTRYSIAQYRVEWLKTGGGIKLGALYTLLLPNYWNVFDMSKFHGPSDPTFLYLYCGIFTLLLALIAAFRKPDRLTRLFAFFTLGATVWMLGDSTPIGRAILAVLPVSIRIGIHPEFTLPVFALSIAVLAGLGAHRSLPPRWQIAAGMLVALDLLLVSSGRPFNTASRAVEAGMGPNSIDGSVALASRIRSLTAAADPPLRYDMADAPFEWSHSSALLQLATANGCDPLALERTIQLRLSFSPGARWGACYQVVNSRSPVLGMANIGFVVSRSPLPLPSVKTIDGYTIYENPHVLPRFFFVPEIRPAGSLEAAAGMLHAADFDPSQAAIVEGSSGAAKFAPAAVHVLSYAPKKITLQTHSAGDAFLVDGDSWYPGWEASIDGRPSPLYITDVAFRGLRVPPGDHRIELQFAPQILPRSALLSLAALAAAVWAMAGRNRREKSPAC